MPILADDQMVVHRDAERFRDLDDRLRHLDVGARGRGVAGGMVVHQDDRGGGELERALDHFAGINRRVIDGADCWRSSAMRWLRLSRKRMRSSSRSP